MLTPRNVFLVDGFGAIATALLTGIVLPSFQQYIGLPVSVLRILGAIAFCFFLYGLFCHYFLGPPRKHFLVAIMTANLLYCSLTAYIMCKYRMEIQAIGILYFIGEMMAILVLCSLEYRALQMCKP